MKWTGLVGNDGVFGGDLVDVTKPYAARDKVQHFIGGAGLFLLLHRWLPTVINTLPVIFGVILFVAILVEVIEDGRERQGKSGPFVDQADGMDVIVTMLGALFAWGVL